MLAISHKVGHLAAALVVPASVYSLERLAGGCCSHLAPRSEVAGGDPSNPRALKMAYLAQSAVLQDYKFNSKDKCALLELHDDCVTYQGVGRNDGDAAAVRTVSPIPSVAFFYFEIKVLNKGRDGYIGIGLCHKTVPLSRLPGWEMGSWGYHGDDGHSFACSGQGKAYGPTFTTGDVVGCCCDYVKNEVFFTKNGMHLGPAFKDVLKDGAVFPCVGLRTPGESVRANFGGEPFVFNIDAYITAASDALWTQIAARPLENQTEVMNKLIYNYLQHHGYTSTAAHFTRLTGVAKIDSPFVVQRSQIRDAILKGDIEQSVELIDAHFPSLFQTHPHIKFQLSCRQFVEMIRYASSVAWTWPSSDAKDALQRCLQFGKGLSAECESLPGDKAGFRRHLADLYSFMAYKDAYANPLKAMLDVSGRETVATAVNSAILADVGESPNTVLENVWKQAVVVKEEMQNKGIPAGFLVGVTNLNSSPIERNR